MKTIYETNLPHIQPTGEVFFVTFRLVDSLPKEVLKKMQDDYIFTKEEIYGKKLPKQKQELQDQRKRYFREFDAKLDTTKGGNHWLKIPEIAEIITKKLHEFDKIYYDLYAYTVMSNHVHVLFDFGKQIDNLPKEILEDFNNLDNLESMERFEIHYKPLYKVLNLIKGASSRYANIALKRTGTFWQKDNYDHYVRNAKELNNIVNYIIQNPVKAGIVEDWREFPFTYLSFA